MRKFQSKALDKEGIKVLKRGRFLPLYNYEDLDSERQERLQAILKVNEPLFIMHSMKEQLRLLWCKKNVEEASKFSM